MKINFTPLITLLVASFATLSAAPVTETTAVHAKPDAASPAVAFLQVGTEPTPAPAAPAPAGWMAVELVGPHEVFVQNKDILKNLDVKPGAAYHVQPKPNTPVLATAEAGDAVEITSPRGRWTELRLNKKIVGYIQTTARSAATTAAATTTPPATTTAAPTHQTGALPSPSRTTPAPAPSPARPFAPSPVAPAAQGSAVVGQAVPMINLGDGGSSALPRLFQGRVVSTRNPFRPRRPYEYQLNDDAGERYAYLDVSKLLLTEQIDKYVDRTVVVYGTAKAVPDSKDMVIQAESLQLR